MNFRKLLAHSHAFALAAFAGLGASQAKAASPAINLTNLASFPAGQTSVAGLVQGANGFFYGTTINGGSNGYGAIFMFTNDANTNLVFTNLFFFNGAGNGAAPDAPMILAKDGYFYGTTSAGGTYNDGVIFRYGANGVFQVMTNFNGTYGATPVGGLVQATNQIFYGAASAGGAGGHGAVFSYSVTNGFELLYSFTGTNDGADPQDGVVIGANGDLYGTTYLGGANGVGTVFNVTTGGGLTTLATFDYTNGAFPIGLVQTTNGNLYGATFAGGSNGFGTVFEIPSGATTNTVLATFDITNGSNPDGPLLRGSNGLIYGTTIQGGPYGSGLVFQVSTNVGGFGHFAGTNVALSAEDPFQGANGAFPMAGLTQGTDGNIYGVTTSGGANGTGGFFEILGFPATVVVPPTNVSLILNATAVFRVTAGGSQPLSYQWLKNGVPLTDMGSISGSETNALTISPEVLTDFGNYSVVVSNIYGVATSAVAQLTVPAPTLAIKYVNQAAGILTVRGTATDKFGVTNVFYRLNSATNWTAAVANGWPNDPITTNWSVNAPMQGGTNIFYVYSVDPLGNRSVTNTAQEFYVTYSTLTVTTNGFGLLNPAHLTVTNLIVDRTYTISAAPSKNNLFSNWTGTVTSTNFALHFLMVSNMMLTANFVTNPFIKAGIAGPYNGLFSVATNITPASSGLIENLKIGTLGTYTGRMYIGGTSYAISGGFNITGSLTNQITRARTLGNLTLVMNLDWNAVPPQVTGSVSGTSSGRPWTAPLLAELAGTGIGSAEYTMQIEPDTTNPAVASPTGTGYATITNHAGAITLAGALADGAAFSENVSESATSNLDVFANPYAGNGLLFGELTLTNGSPEGSLTWIKPATTTGLYTNGYTNIVAVQSSPWTDLGSKTPSFTFTNIDGQLIVAGPIATLPLTFNVGLSNNDVLLLLPGGATNKLAASINSKTGVLTVSITDVVPKKNLSGTGIVLQNQTNAAGYFTTTTNSGSILLH